MLKIHNSAYHDDASLPQVSYEIEGLGLGESLCKDGLKVRKIAPKDKFLFPKKLYTKWFDYDKIRGNLVTRSRQNGDYIRVGKALSKKKIKDFFIDNKIPRTRREQIPMLVDESMVIWIIGHRINDYYKVSDETQVVLEVQYTKED